MTKTDKLEGFQKPLNAWKYLNFVVVLILMHALFLRNTSLDKFPLAELTGEQMLRGLLFLSVLAGYMILLPKFYYIVNLIRGALISSFKSNKIEGSNKDIEFLRLHRLRRFLVYQPNPMLQKVLEQTERTYEEAKWNNAYSSTFFILMTIVVLINAPVLTMLIGQAFIIKIFIVGIFLVSFFRVKTVETAYAVVSKQELDYIEMILFKNDDEVEAKVLLMIENGGKV